MTALSAQAAGIRNRSTVTGSAQVQDAVTVYGGGLIALDDERSSTSGKKGRIAAFAGTAGQILLGRMIAAGSVLGATAATPVPEAQFNLDDEILENVPVAGVTGQLDVGKVFFCPTDNIATDLTLTRPTRAQPLGIIMRYRATGYADVLLLGLVARLALQGVGRKEIVRLGAWDNADLADGNIGIAIPMAFSGKILSVHGVVEKAFTGSGGTALVNLEIDTVDVTGGVVTVSTAAGGTIGTVLAGTAVTGANYFQEGSTIDVEVASAGGTRTAGRVAVCAVVERMAGI